MNNDMTVECGGGFINIRVGAIIIKDGKFLMAGNERNDYLYSVGGRVKFGETAEEAVGREVYEETGVKMEIERLGFVHENYFIGNDYNKSGKLIYEVSLFFYMKVPEDYEPVCTSYTEEDHNREYLKWVSPDTEETVFPEFFRTEIFHPTDGVKHIVTDGRMTTQ